MWTFLPQIAGGRDQRWLANSVALSMETPWEGERKTRLWRLVWDGLLRGAGTPYWELPKQAAQPRTVKNETARIMVGWLPDDEESVTAQTMASLLDDSWLADIRIFNAITDSGTSAETRWRIDAKRQEVAVALFQLRNGAPPRTLAELVPKYFPEGLPVDPYSGQPFHYRVSAGEDIVNIGAVRVGQAVLWGVGPDGVDDGGKKDGVRLGDGAKEPAGFDLITVIP